MTSMVSVAVAMGVAAAEPGWSGGQSVTRFGLPVLLVLLGLALWAWGRKEQQEARAQIGVKGGFGGPPGTLDIGTELGFGVDGPGPDRDAGRTKILAGLVAMAAGAVLLVAMVIWRLVS